jgi:Exostosin family
MRLHVARLGDDSMINDPVLTFERLAEIDRVGKHRLVDADDADVILFPQPHMLPRDWRLTAVRNHPLTARHRGKVMVYDERDRPWCGFPGVYVSMSRRKFDARFQRAWGYFPVAPVDVDGSPDLLFSFVGSPSHPCRTGLVSLRGSKCIVELVNGFTFYDPRSVDFEERQARFRDVLRRSRFVLCPRGKGTSSIRLFETLAMGRVPVIISDDWEAPCGLDWGSFSLRWPEREISGLVEYLEERDVAWAEMSAAATSAYREFFAPDVWFDRVAELLAELRASSQLDRFPESGCRNAAFFGAGAGVAHSQAILLAQSVARSLSRFRNPR